MTVVNDHDASRKERSPAAALTHGVQVTANGVVSAPLFMAGGRIVPTAPEGAWRLDLRDHFVLPGMVNAHDHLQINAFPLIQFAEPFPNSYAWIDAMQPRMEATDFQAARAIPTAIRHWHGALKNLLGGVTTVAHHDPVHPVFDAPGFPVGLLRRFGWSHSLGLGLPDNARSALRFGPDVRESFATTPAGWPWILHLAEGTDRVAQGELLALDALGCLMSNTVIVHGVGLTAADQERIIACGAGVIWCPGSNLTMLGATLDPRRLLDAGRLALGSDSRLSGPADLLDNLRLAARSSDCTPRELFALVTEAPSRLLSMPEVGGLADGQRADLIIVRDQGRDPCSALIDLSRSDLRAVVRDGVPALADPDFADWFEACGIDCAPILLDGRPKLIAASLLDPPEAAALEPGLTHIGGC